MCFSTPKMPPKGELPPPPPPPPTPRADKVSNEAAAGQKGGLRRRLGRGALTIPLSKSVNIHPGY
mgnify:CR=1 FL=1